MVRPGFPESQYVERIEDLLRILNERTKGPIGERARELAVEVLQHVPELLAIPFLLEYELRKQKVNVGALRRALRLLIEAPKLADIEALYVKADNPPSRWQAILEKELADLDEDLSPQDPLTLLATFRLILPKRFFDLQAVSTTEGPHISALMEMVEQAISKWPDDLLLAQVREARAEFAAEPSVLAFPRALAPQELFDARTIEEIRAALAAYVVRDRPRLVQEWLRDRGESWPDRAVPLADILTNSDSGEALPREPTASEKRAFAALLRLLSLSSQLFRADERLLRNAIGLNRSFISIRTIADWIGRWEKNKGAPLLELFLVELKTLVRDLGLLTQTTPIEVVLRSYKLRNEVLCRPPHPELDEGTHELHFQRHLCAYLIDFGIPSFGTKFGRMETDLILKSHPSDEEFVVEAKVIRAKTTVGSARKTIKEAFVQLRRYMDDMPTMRRGILLVYSFAPFAIVAASEWIRRLYRVVIVDLSKATTSARSHGLVVEEGPVGSGVELEVNDIAAPPEPKSQRPKSRASKRKRQMSVR